MVFERKLRNDAISE